MLDTDTVRWQRDFPAQPTWVAEARRAATARAAAIGAGEEIVRDIALAVSEAATNVVVHAFVDRSPGIMRVMVEPGDGRVIVRVLDDGRGFVPRSDSPGIGLGLPTIGQLTESFDIRDGLGERGTEVRMVFAAPGVVPPEPAEPDDEDPRYRLLSDLSRLPGAGWPGPGVERLVELLVPRVADACTVDLVEQGTQRRVAARVDDDPELTAWLAGRRPPEEIIQRVLEAMRTGDVSIVDVDAESNARLAAQPEDLVMMERAALRWWVNVPLMDGDTLLGSLGLGLRAGRPAPRTQLAFLATVGERAARGVATTQLIDELQRTRNRLENILAALSEAITVHDERGKTVYANPAAARLLGAASVDEVLAAQPGDLAARFEITREDGAPVTVDDLPGRRLVAGLPAEPLLTRSVRRDTGEARWLLTKATLLEGEQMLAVNIIEDVTELKEAEERLRALGDRAAQPEPG
jgi:PAS domain S-box-containing protein